MTLKCFNLFKCTPRACWKLTKFSNKTGLTAFKYAHRVIYQSSTNMEVQTRLYISLKSKFKILSHDKRNTKIPLLIWHTFI